MSSRGNSGFRVLVSGHRNPDIDSLAAAAALAELRRRQGYSDITALCPGVLPERAAALFRRFRLKPPAVCNDVYTRIRDVISPVPAIRAGTTLLDAVGMLRKSGRPRLPVTDGEGRFLGMLSSLALLSELLGVGSDAGNSLTGRRIRSSLRLIRRVLEAEELTGFDQDSPQEFEVYVAAMSLGLEALAITDHGERHPLIGVKPSRFDEMRRDVDAVAKEYRFRVLLGIEANILSPKGEIDLSPEDAAKLDVVLAGFHLTAYPLRFRDYFKLPFNGVTRYLCRNSAKQRAMNTEAFVRAVTEHEIDVLTHPGFRLDVELKPIGEACAATGTFVELSSRHKTPDLEVTEILAATGAKLIVNSDAHKPARVGKCEYALDMVQKLGLDGDTVVNISDKPIVFRRGTTV